MDRKRVLEIDQQLVQIKVEEPKVYCWIAFKNRQKFLNEELRSKKTQIEIDNYSEELDKTEGGIEYLEENYTLIKLFKALVFEKQDLEKKLKKDN